MTLTEYLKHFIGTPYIWGGNGTGKTSGGFDCSGLVLEGLWAMGMYSGSDTTAQGLYNSLVKSGKWEGADWSNAHDGDILFFGKSMSKITHVAVALGDGLMIEAGGGGSSCKSVATSTGFVRIRPIRGDVLACLYMKR
jgi:cell wall-associated NlpC family hydrolase